jgi:hypothetical protein
VLADRHPARALKTPRTAHFALRNVLLDARKHARRTAPFAASSEAPTPDFIDSRSSAACFDGFERPGELVFGAREVRRYGARHFRARSAHSTATHVTVAP